MESSLFTLTAIPLSSIIRLSTIRLTIIGYLVEPLHQNPPHHGFP